ncbi:MAG: multicopper oxidase family protein [Pseudomonadota bacterium]
MKLTRRHMMQGGIALNLGVLGGITRLAADAPETFELASRRTSYAFGQQRTEGLVSTIDNGPPPVLRMRQGEPVVLNYHNGLKDFSTMHWHGIRLPNDMDGVPYLTQLPVAQGETFRYAFTPPDAGTFWYHPHCMTMAQMAEGLTGLMVVEERDDPGFDADIALNLKDFHLDGQGALMPYFTPRGAARGGTLGSVKTTNWQVDPVYDVPAGGLIRLRFGVTDTTRIHKLVLPDVPGRILAWDGQPVEEPIPWPTIEAPLYMGPGQRVDVVIVAPRDEGQEMTFQSLIGRRTPFNVARFRAVGQDLGRVVEDIQPLPKNPFEASDISAAEVREIEFGWSPEGDGSNNGLCGSFGYIFWSINRRPWPGDAVEGTGAVVNMELGKSYILRMRNSSPNTHPIHLHGLLMKPLRSNQRQIPANYTDTILLFEDEIIDVAVLADNLGDWAFHCHVIEHQKTGLSGYVSVA